jgi:hypothetical protein
MDHTNYTTAKNSHLWVTKSEFSLNLVHRIIFSLYLGHDESTFRAGEISSKRWIIDDNAPFFNKGRGRSIMISDYIVQHPSGAFFRLNSQEWYNAIKKYPDLLNDTDINYEEYSATASIIVGVDAYFDNQTILNQFERLFKLLQFKKDFKNHSIEVVVDNARTHTCREYSLHDFGMKPGTRCPVEMIQYIDDKNRKQIVNCYFTSGPFAGQSKGLLQIARDLGLTVSVGCKLDELKSVLIKHPAFNNVRKIITLKMFLVFLNLKCFFMHFTYFLDIKVGTISFRLWS